MDTSFEESHVVGQDGSDNITAIATGAAIVEQGVLVG